MSTVYGLEIPDLPEDHEPLEALVVVRCRVPADQGFHPDRPETLWVSASPNMTPWDAVGLATVAYQRSLTHINFGK